MALRYGGAMQSTDATGGSGSLHSAITSRPLIDLRTGEPVEAPRRIAFKPAEVAEMLGVGERYVWTLIESEELKSVKLANRRMVLAEDLDTFVEQLKAERDRARGAA